MKYRYTFAVRWGCFLLICLINLAIGAEGDAQPNDVQIIPLPDLLEPIAIEVTETSIYIPEKSVISVYSRRDFHLEQRFGKQGEGPGEFRYPPYVTAYPGFLLINNSSKLMFYSRQGEFIKEVKLPFSYNYWAWPLLVAGENYVGIPLEITEKREILHVCRIYDAAFEPIKVLADRIVPSIPPPPPVPRPGARSVRIPKQDYQAAPDCISCFVIGETIYLADTRQGFHIGVLDQKGKPLHIIDKPHKSRKVSSRYKRAFMEKLESLPQWDRMKDIFNVRFKEIFPAFFSIKSDGERIYVVTYAEKESRYEIITMDLKGHELSRSFSFPIKPFARVFSDFPAIDNAYDIHVGKLYYLTYDDPTDVYQLNIMDFE
jgi:hypothetical protein